MKRIIIVMSAKRMMARINESMRPGASRVFIKHRIIYEEMRASEMAMSEGPAARAASSLVRKHIYAIGRQSINIYTVWSGNTGLSMPQISEKKIIRQSWRRVAKHGWPMPGDDDGAEMKVRNKAAIAITIKIFIIFSNVFLKQLYYKSAPAWWACAP